MTVSQNSQPSPAPAFSLVIPCFNEARALPELIERCAFVARTGGGEVILVNNGSTDDSEEVLKKLLPASNGLVRSVTVKENRGYGFGILSGLAEARAPIVGWTHADLQTDPVDVLRALPTLEDNDGPILIKGRRYGRNFSDRFFTAGMSVFESLLFVKPLTDIYGQPTLFSRELIDEWGEPPEDFALDLFALYSARRLKYRVVRFPVIFAPRKFGSSSWNFNFAAKRKFIKRTVSYSFALRKKL